MLYLRRGQPTPAADTYGTPEGHAVRFDDDGQVIGLTIVNAKWLTERDGKLVITIPNRIETSAADLAQAFQPA